MGTDGETLVTQGALIVRQALSRQRIEAWRALAEARYTEVDRVCAAQGPWTVSAALNLPFVPTASSLGLQAFGDVGREVAETLDIALGPLLEKALNGPVRPLFESAWLRRQFAPRHAPAYHAPHAWHQDGGLGFDYLHDSDLRGGLLPMVTCWIPLVACGRTAPGVAFLPHRPGTLLSLAELAASRASATVPELAPGDVLVMMGDLLHRTHVTPEMTGDRISVELRFLPADHPGRRGPWSGPTE